MNLDLFIGYKFTILSLYLDFLQLDAIVPEM